jgi:hypothetical protein
MIPHEKALVERLKGKPFALLGINSDGDAATVRKIMKENGITWRNAVEGSTDGPLATRWNVQGWPTIYVLDARGVIRYREVRDKEMDEAVDALLKELEGTK